MSHILGLTVAMLVLLANVNGYYIMNMSPKWSDIGDRCDPLLHTSSKLMCCGRTTVKRPRNASCCGERSYNTDWYLCCNETINYKPGNNACCGTRPYHTEYEICCRRRVFVKRAVNNGRCPPHYENGYENIVNPVEV